MAKPKKTPDSKSIADVAHPGTSAPSDTSKPIITPRPIIKDPMMVEDEAKTNAATDEKTEDEAKKAPIVKASELKIDPIDDKTDDAKEDNKDKKAEAKDGTQKESGKGSDESKSSQKAEGEPEPDENGKKTAASAKAEAPAETEEDPHLQKLIDSKKYFLPINAVEHRRSARFVAVGVILALILTVAWVDVALDAGLIHLNGIKPVTHLFSN